MDTSSVCRLLDSNGEPVIKIFGTSLAEKWKLDILFTGLHFQCLEYIENEK